MNEWRSTESLIILLHLKNNIIQYIFLHSNDSFIWNLEQCVKWISTDACDPRSSKERSLNSYIKDRSHMHEFTLFLFFKARISTSLNNSLWSLFTKPAEEDSGLCSCAIRRRKEVIRWSRKGEGMKLFLERKKKNKSQKRGKKREAIGRDREVTLTHRRNAAQAAYSTLSVIIFNILNLD